MTILDNKLKPEILITIVIYKDYIEGNFCYVNSALKPKHSTKFHTNTIPTQIQPFPLRPFISFQTKHKAPTPKH